MDQVAEFFHQMNIYLRLFEMKERQEKNIAGIYIKALLPELVLLSLTIFIIENYLQISSVLAYKLSIFQPSPSHKLPNILHHVASTLHIKHFQMAEVRLGH